MQKERAICSIDVKLSNAYADRLREISESLPSDKVIVRNINLKTGPNHSNTITFTLVYGPVWGCWQSDIRARLNAAIRRARTNPTIELSNFVREVIETRETADDVISNKYEFFSKRRAIPGFSAEKNRLLSALQQNESMLNAHVKNQAEDMIKRTKLIIENLEQRLTRCVAIA